MHFFNFTQKSKQRFHLINCSILGDICHLNNSCTGSLRSCSHDNWSILRKELIRSTVSALKVRKNNVPSHWKARSHSGRLETGHEKNYLVTFTVMKAQIALLLQWCWYREVHSYGNTLQMRYRRPLYSHERLQGEISLITNAFSFFVQVCCKSWKRVVASKRSKSSGSFFFFNFKPVYCDMVLM